MLQSNKLKIILKIYFSHGRSALNHFILTPIEQISAP